MSPIRAGRHLPGSNPSLAPGRAAVSLVAIDGRRVPAPRPLLHPRSMSQSPRTAVRTHGFTESVIREMTRVAREAGAINLAQGFPDFPAPQLLKDAACRAIQDDVNQYAIT